MPFKTDLSGIGAKLVREEFSDTHQRETDWRILPLRLAEVEL